jgi:hypothetical protein
MLLTKETDSAQSISGKPTASVETQAGEYLTGSWVIREVPVVMLGGAAVSAPNHAQLHYSKLRVEGIQSLIPDTIEVDIAPIASGGQIRIDELPMPPCCEVIGVWFANPVVTVSKQA